MKEKLYDEIKSKMVWLSREPFMDLKQFDYEIRTWIDDVISCNPDAVNTVEHSYECYARVSAVNENGNMLSVRYSVDKENENNISFSVDTGTIGDPDSVRIWWHMYYNTDKNVIYHDTRQYVMLEEIA